MESTALAMSRFLSVDEEAVRSGRVTDVYFERCAAVLEREGINPLVAMEVSASSLSDGRAVFCGLADAVALFEDRPVSCEAVPEGTFFSPFEPVLRLTGRYRDIAVHETALLGFLCHASGIATAAARICRAAGDRPVYSFGSRRQHPAIAPMVERAAWIGGVAGVSNAAAPEGIPLTGTMPHAYVMCFPRQEDAWAAFARNAPADVPRVMLCDTWDDETDEAVRAAETGAEAVRLDTPASRRGDLRTLVEEVRWELDIRGHGDVEIILSGGLTEADVARMRDIVDGFGVGGAIAGAPVVDYSLDIVEIDGVPVSKRGKRSGAKEVALLPDGSHTILPRSAPVPAGACPLFETYIDGGRIAKRPDTAAARQWVAEQQERESDKHFED
ncbi:MAG: nicotinate phosphoribosyltransferase [Methanomicrobiales archaeon]